MNPGIYDISEVDYQGDRIGDVPSLSASIAKILCTATPLHAWTAHPRLNPNFQREDKELFDLGTVAHALMLQGIQSAVVITEAADAKGVVKPIDDWKLKDAKRQRDEVRAAGKIPVLSKHWDRIQAMVTAGKAQLAAHKEARNAFSDGKPEQTLVWVDDHGVQCRARLDWLKDSRKGFSDYKSTGMTANPEAISRSLFGASWDVQEAFYRRGLKKLGYEAEGVFVCQEDSPPYALSAIGFNPLIMRVADGKVQMAIDLWAKCLKENNWPGYPDRTCYPEMPKWMEERAMEKELANAL